MSRKKEKKVGEYEEIANFYYEFLGEDNEKVGNDGKTDTQHLALQEVQ